MNLHDPNQILRTFTLWSAFAGTLVSIILGAASAGAPAHRGFVHAVTIILLWAAIAIDERPHAT